MKYDLKERTCEFGKNIIRFVKQVPENTITRPLILQIMRSGTSIGANYCEAINSGSKKDFMHKICIVRKEAQETYHWLIMLETATPEFSIIIKPLLQESHELILIFNSIFHSRKSFN